MMSSAQLLRWGPMHHPPVRGASPCAQFNSDRICCTQHTVFFLVLFVVITTILLPRNFSWLSSLHSGLLKPCTSNLNLSSLDSWLTFPTARPTPAMMDLSKRVAALGPTIEKLMSIGGTAGLSLGLLHHGKPIYQASYGLRDVPANLPVTEETILPGCSLTKALTAATIALLVEEEKVTWDTLVKDVLPDFKIKDEILHNCTTIADLLCHCTGMSWGDNLYMDTNHNVLISGKDSMEYLNSQMLLLPFRGQFQYNNLPYELAGHVIEKVDGLALGRSC